MSTAENRVGRPRLLQHRQLVAVDDPFLQTQRDQQREFSALAKGLPNGGRLGSRMRHASLIPALRETSPTAVCTSGIDYRLGRFWRLLIWAAPGTGAVALDKCVLREVPARGASANSVAVPVQALCRTRSRRRHEITERTR